MYICPTCGAEFSTEKKIQSHLLSCWKSHNPNYKSKNAPRSKDITTREVNEETLNFFSSLGNYNDLSNKPTIPTVK